MNGTDRANRRSGAPARPPGEPAPLPVPAAVSANRNGFAYAAIRVSSAFAAIGGVAGDIFVLQARNAGRPNPVPIGTRCTAGRRSRPRDERAFAGARWRPHGFQP